MPWVSFTRDFHFKTSRLWQSFAAGETLNVTSPAAAAALAAGAAEKVAAPRRRGVSDTVPPADPAPTLAPVAEGKTP